ncbi:SapC family protein [Catenovulum sediminis]|uniref:SapC family protein n=1 Tax=Catenovulum sediminis TaxID=1740262 RepID=A0ABV1RFN8_9ALTE|nr:SapC family protein [Catenovulum sediminis]
MELGIYQKIEILSKDQHFNTKISPLEGYQFSQQLRECVVTGDEFFECAKSLPILFTKNPQGRLVSFALLGIQPEQNVMLDENGQWRAGEYIPAFLRRYPFVFVQEKQQLMLALDAQSKSVNGEKGEALFEKNGDASEFTLNVMNFMKQYENACRKTESIIAKLDSLGLLEQAKAEMTSGGKTYAIKGFMRVNENKLAELSDEVKIELINTGIYKLIVAHLISLSNFKKLSVLAN